MPTTSQMGNPQDPEEEASHGLPCKHSEPTTTTGGTPAKAVSIAEPESTSTPTRGKIEHGDSFDQERRVREHRASLSTKRLSGRPSKERLTSSKRSSIVDSPAMTALLAVEAADAARADQPRHHHSHDLIKQVGEWIKNEKARRAAKKTKRKEMTTAQSGAAPSVAEAERRSSVSSDGSAALEELSSLLGRTMSLHSNEGTSHRRKHSGHGHRLGARLKRHTTASSDTDYFDGEPIVPACEAILDNSKTLSYSGGTVPSDDASASASKDKEAWSTFKYEIVRLAHTLRLKGWRRVPLENSNDIEVERLSGALTNAVYVVSPPKNLPTRAGQDKDALPVPRNPPPKLLLRIYGPQVEHLIDREVELQILRRLARKRIGPRLLGTFTNGRFEEFFHAKPLTPQELRNPETSKQIAKRMRELHVGIDLEKREREEGPFVWRNWDKWVDRCEQIVTWLDQQVKEIGASSPRLSGVEGNQRGFVCGVEWRLFRELIEKYRTWLNDQYGGAKMVNQRLVFAHNDTQYGNILRMVPEGESPLLLPANEHKQLVVIDFEYANANLPGLEFANHFTEWCYNYHDAVAPHLCNTQFYPTPEEQHRFIRSYLLHNPSVKAKGGAASNPPTPLLGPLPTSTSMTSLAATTGPPSSSSISAFMLDSRAPPGEKYSYYEEEAERERRIEEEATRLMAETRLWRLANSAQWVAWGIVQANIPGMPQFDEEEGTKSSVEHDINPTAQKLESATLEVRAEAAKESGGELKKTGEEDGGEAKSVEETAEEQEFDYLAYAQDRAMFVWGDAIHLGFLKLEDLPEQVRDRVKMVEY